MADEISKDNGSAPGRGVDEVALEMMKFIALTTGYGKGAPAAGFGGKSTARTPEEYAEALLDLFLKCKKTVKSEPPA